MVAAFRDDPRDPQLPFQAWQHPSGPVSPSPSFDYADPVQSPSVQVNPAIRPPLSREAIAVSHLPPQPQRPIQSHPPQSQPMVQYEVPSRPYAQAQASQTHAIQVRSQRAAIRPTASHVSLARQPIRSTPVPSGKIQTVRSQSSVMSLPKPAPYAPWVQRLMVGQKGICLLTLTLVGCALSLYGQSVYQHRQWGQSYVELEQLQKLEQQGIAASEIMKQSLAEEAELPTSQMSSQMPSKSIPIETVPARNFKDANIPTESVLDMDLDGPMGY